MFGKFGFFVRVNETSQMQMLLDPDAKYPAGITDVNRGGGGAARTEKTLNSTSLEGWDWILLPVEKFTYHCEVIKGRTEPERFAAFGELGRGLLTNGSSEISYERWGRFRMSPSLISH